MKKFFIMMVMLMAMVVNADAQLITCMEMIGGQDVVWLQDGTYRTRKELVPGCQYHVGMTIQDCELLYQRERMSDYYSRFNTRGMGMGMLPMIGGNGSSTYLQVGKARIYSANSNYGGYTSSSTGIQFGDDFAFSTARSGYSQPATTSAYTRGTTTVSPAQKKADAKVATARYSNMRNAGVVKNSGSVQKTTTTSTTSSNNTTVVREISLRSLLK